MCCNICGLPELFIKLCSIFFYFFPIISIVFDGSNHPWNITSVSIYQHCQFNISIGQHHIWIILLVITNSLASTVGSTQMKPYKQEQPTHKDQLINCYDVFTPCGSQTGHHSTSSIVGGRKVKCIQGHSFPEYFGVSSAAVEHLKL